MTPGERSELTRIVERHKAINAQIQDLKWEVKELAEAAWDKCGVKPKVVKQLAKEAAWDQVQREEQRQLEEQLDECRAALGLLADLPLGQAAQHSVTNPLYKAAANGTGAHVNGTNGTGGAVKRGRGRPPGAKNKPKAPQPQPAGEAESPPIPDWPDAA